MELKDLSKPEKDALSLLVFIVIAFTSMITFLIIA